MDSLWQSYKVFTEYSYEDSPACKEHVWTGKQVDSILGFGSPLDPQYSEHMKYKRLNQNIYILQVQTQK